jgi:hypothetical protein
MNSNPDRPKIIIDEDWKSQVEAERERLKSGGASSPGESASSAAAAAERNPATERHRSVAAGESREVPESLEVPPASFELLISTLATQAMIALGQIPDPMDDRLVVQLEVARHHIDMLELLQSKTRGNLSPDEARMLESILHQLRLAFLHVENHS